MLRRLLTCLALLTGLAAAGTPVQAHIAEAEIARIEAGLHDAAGDPAKTVTASHRTKQSAYARVISDRPATRAKSPLALSVLIGIDRARE